jgi:hypothetical protein
LNINHPLNPPLRRRGGKPCVEPLFFSKSPPDPLFEEEGEIVGENWESPSFSLNHPLNPPLRRRGGNSRGELGKPLFFKEGFGVI